MAQVRIVWDRAYLRIHYGEHIDFINVLPFYFSLQRKDV